MFITERRNKPCVTKPNPKTNDRDNRSNLRKLEPTINIKPKPKVNVKNMPNNKIILSIST